MGRREGLVEEEDLGEAEAEGEGEEEVAEGVAEGNRGHEGRALRWYLLLIIGVEVWVLQSHKDYSDINPCYL